MRALHSPWDLLPLPRPPAPSRFSSQRRSPHLGSLASHHLRSHLLDPSRLTRHANRCRPPVDVVPPRSHGRVRTGHVLPSAARGQAGVSSRLGCRRRAVRLRVQQQPLPPRAVVRDLPGRPPLLVVRASGLHSPVLLHLHSSSPPLHCAASLLQPDPGILQLLSHHPVLPVQQSPLLVRISHQRLHVLLISSPYAFLHPLPALRLCRSLALVHRLPSQPPSSLGQELLVGRILLLLGSPTSAHELRDGLGRGGVRLLGPGFFSLVPLAFPLRLFALSSHSA